jgi:hypothetical protein
VFADHGGQLIEPTEDGASRHGRGALCFRGVMRQGIQILAVALLLAAIGSSPTAGCSRTRVRRPRAVLRARAAGRRRRHAHARGRRRGPVGDRSSRPTEDRRADVRRERAEPRPASSMLIRSSTRRDRGRDRRSARRTCGTRRCA